MLQIRLLDLATDTGDVAAGKNVTVSNAGSIAQLTAIDTADGNGTLTYCCYRYS